MSKYRGSTKSTKDLMNITLKKVFLNRGYLFAELMTAWGDIVGCELSSQCYPVKIASIFEEDKKMNLLYIAANDVYNSFIISHKKEIIIERIAIYLGFKAIDQVKIKSSLLI